MSFNSVVLEGNLGADAEVKELSNDNKVANLNIAAYNGKDANGENKTMWVTVTAWKFTAERCESLKKGDRVVVSGYLAGEEWEQDGSVRRKLKITANNVHKVEKVASGVGGSSTGSGSKAKSTSVEDDFDMGDDEVDF